MSLAVSSLITGDAASLSFIFADLTPPPPNPASGWFGGLELTIAGLSALCAIALAWNNFCLNRRMGTSWTTDQINSFMIPFAMAVMFVVIFFATR